MSQIEAYFDRMGRLPMMTEITNDLGGKMAHLSAFSRVSKILSDGMSRGKVAYFIGNGGSSSIASHMAEDYTKNGGIRSMAFNDAALITCLANDCGYENIFAKAVEFYAQRGDTIIAISSSGNSQNIINACQVAKKKKCNVITLSGFKPDNKLRKLGKVNFYVPAQEYGYVECTHNTLLHAILDLNFPGVK